MIYNTIKHDIRNKANLSLLDYCLLESIYLLSNSDKSKYKTWCNAAKSSFEYLASARTIVTRFNELEKDGWLEFYDESRMLKRTTQKYYEEVYSYILGVKKLHSEEIAPVQLLHTPRAEVAHLDMQKLHTPRAETSPNNNIDNTNDNNIEKESTPAIKIEVPIHKNDEEQKTWKQPAQYEIAIQDYHFRNWTIELKEAFYAFCLDKYEKNNKFSGTQAKEIIRQIETDLIIHGAQRVENCLRLCLRNGWAYKIMYQLNDEKREAEKSQKAETGEQPPEQLEAYLLKHYQQKEVEYFKKEGKFEKWQKELEDNRFRLTNMAKGYKNENITPLLLFEMFYLPLSYALNGSNPTRKQEAFERLFAKQTQYNQDKGDFRQIIKQEYEKQKA